MILLLLSLLAVPIRSGCPAAGGGAASEDSVVAFTNVIVLPMDEERVLEDQTVLVRGGVITEVGPSKAVEIPTGARRVDGRGRYLLPGLSDVHVHLRSTDEFLSYLAHGVTTVVHMSGAMSGAPDLLRYREELAGGERVGPTLYTTGPMLDGHPPIFASVSTIVTTPNLSFVAMTRRQIDDLGGVLADPEARYLHPDVRAMWASQNPTRRSDLERFDRRERAKYRFLQRLTEALSKAGVPLLLGTDASAPGMYPGASAHLELRELVAAGLTPYEALAAGTRNAGAFIQEHVEGADPFGVVAPGQRADLLLVRGNPLEDIANASSIEGVMVRGRWLPGAELERLRERRAGSYER